MKTVHELQIDDAPPTTAQNIGGAAKNKKRSRLTWSTYNHLELFSSAFEMKSFSASLSRQTANTKLRCKKGGEKKESIHSVQPACLRT